MFEGGNLLNLNLTNTCDQRPLKTLQLHKLCDSVAEPSLPTSVRFIILFLRELCQFAFVCVQHNMHNMCTHKKSRLSCSCPKFVTQKKKNCFCMALVLSLHG